MAIFFPPLEDSRTNLVDADGDWVQYVSREKLLKDTIFKPRSKDILVFIYKKNQEILFNNMVQDNGLTPHLAFTKSELTNSGHTPRDLTVAIFTRFGKHYKNRVKVVNL